MIDPLTVGDMMTFLSRVPPDTLIDIEVRCMNEVELVSVIHLEDDHPLGPKVTIKCIKTR